MKKFFAVLGVFCVFGSPLTAQINVGGVPIGIQMGLDLSDVPRYSPVAFDLDATVLEDQARAEAGLIPADGRVLDLGIGTDADGMWTTLPDGSGLWRARISSPNAMATELIIRGYHVPEGARLFVHSDDGTVVQGGFTAANNSYSGSFSIDRIPGIACVVEYHEPANVRGQGTFRIESLVHVYRDLEVARAADPCQVDVICSPEGDNWQDEAKGVVRIRIINSGAAYWCSGSLMNNTANDCKGFVLTALHCSLNSNNVQAPASDLDLWKFYFLYQRGNCGSGFVSAGKVMTGCDRRADSNDGGGTNGSDFLLVELQDPIPTSYTPYWNGWDASGSGSNSGVSIHHPAGSEKKISTYTSQLLTSPWVGNAQSHWRVTWTGTQNGHGVTEGGSSGSPIFNGSGLVLGTLTGGGSCCTNGGCGLGTGPTAPDFYGKMSYHWTQNPNPGNEKLKVWLDPGNTGATTLSGTYAPCAGNSIRELSAPVALSIFPDPAIGDEVTVVFPDGVGAVDLVQVIDLSGRIVQSARSNGASRMSLPVGELSAGSYVVHALRSGRVTGAGRLIVLGR